jgi:hypothetical protein
MVDFVAIENLNSNFFNFFNSPERGETDKISNNNNIVYNFSEIYKISKKFETLFRAYFGYPDRREMEAEFPYSIFKIAKNGQSIFSKPNSIPMVKERAEKIKDFYEEFIDEVGEYLDSVLERVSESSQKSLGIIYKIISKKKKSFFSTIARFEADENSSLSKIIEDFFWTIQKKLSPIMKELLTSFENGLKSEKMIYAKLIKIFNKFLSKLGVYTETIFVDDKINYDTTDPQDGCENCDTKDRAKKDIIKEVLSLPYLIDVAKEPQPLLEGKVYIWRMV